ncbi:lipopolysaccharide biosynthesis protein [Ferriphaselus sp. R-1]|uniref:lipopolysaccharide biosynthesis protein n=1 Tax=Ferriphaselus sp. R-1 TaxID=1485544 RepID=UPI00126891E5|nr:lipopolysaccharide biosynthesis protein [Ferriphaselus sp. R-1]
MSLKAKLIRNLGANAYGQFVTIVIQLASVPLFLRYWGIELYGEWLILSAIPAYLSLSDIGFASVAANDMTMRVAKGDQQGALEVFQSIFLFIFGVTTLIGSVVAVLIFNFPVGQLLSVSHVSPVQTAQVLFVLMVYVMFGLQGAVFIAGFRAIGRYALGTILNNSVRLAEWGGSVVTLVLGGNLLLVAMVMLVIRLLGTIGLWVVLRVLASWLTIGLHDASWHRVQVLFKPSIAFMAFPLGLALSLQGMVLVVGALLGPAYVALFSACRTLTRVLVQMITMLNQAVWPEISAAYGTGKLDVITNLHRKGSSITFWVALGGVVVLGVSGESIVSMWTRHAFETSHILMILLLASTLVNVLWQTSWVVLMATNNHKKISVAFLAMSSGSLGLSALLIPKLGINGAGLATFLIEIPMLYLAVNSVLKLLGDSWATYLKLVISNPFERKLDQL